MDVTSRESVRGMIQRIEEKWGHLDILKNNAGLFAALPQRQSAWEVPDEEFDRVMAANVRGIYCCVVESLPLMRKGNWGRIINIASGLSFSGFPQLDTLCRLERRCGQSDPQHGHLSGQTGITVNAIARAPLQVKHCWRPGQTTIQRVAQSRIIKRVEVPEGLVGTLLFLASPASDFMTGQTIVVDGGSVLH